MSDMENIELALSSSKDDLFERSIYPRPFSFNEDVASVFDDMVQRSIPLYKDVSVYLLPWVKSFYQEGTAVIDIGCSTGTSLHAIGHYLDQRANLIGIDNSQAMIEKARNKLKDLSPKHDIKLICEDVLNVRFEDASVVIMNYTLQFLPASKRLVLLKKIYDSLRPGGLLFYSEKLRSAHPVVQEMKTVIYEKFKENQGYSKTEIARKKEALENVLVPNTEKEHEQLLQKAGFTHYESVMKWNNFISMIAIKDLI